MNLAREPSFRLGGMEVRPATREIVHSAGRDVLEPRVMAVLVRLAQGKGEVVTRDELTEACWDGRVVSDDAINRVISRIRRVSELTGGKDFTLETITKVGYRLVAHPPAILRPAVSQQSSQQDASPASLGSAPSRKAKPAVLAAIAAALAVVLATGGWWLFGRTPEWNPDPKASLTLAVLPFDNLGASTEDQGLALGLSREIRNTLSRVRGLRVVSDTSSFAVAMEPLGATDIGKRLNADLLLDGSFAREGNTVKLSAELVDGWSGVNLWTGAESGPAADLGRLREMMSAAVFEQLVVRLGPDRVEKLSATKPENPQVYRLLLEAQQHLQTIGPMRMRGRAQEGLDAGDAANALVDQALAIDPASASALGLKAAIISMGATRELFEKNLPVPDKQAQSAVYLRRALASDPDYAPALAALGEYYRRFEWRWDEARVMLQRAIALDPNRSDAHLSYAYYLSTSGRCVEALKHARIAGAIDPEFDYRTLGVPRILKCLGRHKEADAAYMVCLNHDPSNVFVLREMYLNYLMRGDAEGLEQLRQHVRDELWKGAPNSDVQLWLDWTATAVGALRGDRKPFVELIERDARGGQGQGVIRALNESNRSKGDVMWIQAVEFAAAGEPKRAIDMLEASMSVGTLYIPDTMPYGAYEFSAEVRADPRYQALWKSDPRLVEIARLRLEAAKARQFDAVLPDGTRVVPAAEISTANR